MDGTVSGAAAGGVCGCRGSGAGSAAAGADGSLLHLQQVPAMQYVMGSKHSLVVRCGL